MFKEHQAAPPITTQEASHNAVVAGLRTNL